MKSFLLALLFSFPVLGQDCASLNLLTAKDSPFNKLPVYDQDGIGICYAYTASQLADYYLIQNGGERSVHPLWGALKLSEADKKSTISIGHTDLALKQIIKKGNCHYNKISGTLSEWASKANIRESDVISLIEIFASKLKVQQDAKSSPLAEDEVEDVINAALNGQKNYCSPGATLEQLIPELKSLSVMSSREMLSQLILPACQKPEKIKLPGVAYYSKKSGQENLRELKKQLINRATPVSINYCSEVLYKPAFSGGDRTRCSMHASLIVGMRKDENKCQLLLRNTWGTGFGTHTDNWKCLCKKRDTGEMVDDCTASTHNNGMYTVEACWIDSDAIERNIDSLSYLKTQKRN